MNAYFGVRWLDTAFNSDGQAAAERIEVFEIQSGVKPPDSKMDQNVAST